MGMTPERKKKLRTLLRKKAAEELKKEQERKAEERLRVIAERCGTKADLDNASTDELKKICQQYFDKCTPLKEKCSSSSVRSSSVISRSTSSPSPSVTWRASSSSPPSRRCPSMRTNLPSFKRKPPSLLSLINTGTRGGIIWPIKDKTM